MSWNNYEITRQFNLSYISYTFVVLSASGFIHVVVEIVLELDCFDQATVFQEARDTIMSFAEFDPFAATDSDSRTLQVMSSSLGSILHAPDWSSSRVGVLRLQESKYSGTISKIESSVPYSFNLFAISPTIVKIFLISLPLNYQIGLDILLHSTLVNYMF